MSTYNPEAARAWLRILHGDSPGQIHICSTGDWVGRVFTNLDAATGYITYLDGEGREGIYARITTLRTDLPPGKRGGAADSAALPALWADLDLAGPGHAEQDLPPDEQAGRTVIAATGLPEPTLWIHSGGGLYPIWLLEKPALVDPGNLDALKRLAADWQRIIEHAAAGLGWRYGRGVGDLARVLRVPGTVNRKEGLARPCRIITATAHRYTVDELQGALDAAVARIAPPAPVVPAAPAVGALTPVTPRTEGQITPGDDFTQRTEWAAILEPAGWRVHYTQDDVTYWTRPGKRTGISASTNALGTDRLHVFTTSAAPLEGGESYSKFGAYAALYLGGDHSAAARALGRQGFGSPLPDPAQQQRENLAALLGGTVTDPSPAPVEHDNDRGAPERTDTSRKPLRLWAPGDADPDVTNTAEAADWLREEAGQGRLAGLFRRLDAVVHTPREGEDGYVPLTESESDNDGPAQVRPVSDSTLASRISYTYSVYRWVKGPDGEPEKKQTLFPRTAARTALDVPDLLPNLRTLRGVIHSPVVRRDGTLIEAPGYDDATGLLHLPEPGLTVPPVADRPDSAQVAAAVALLLEMVEGFPFVNEHYRANYLGCLLTPLLRALTPPPYKLHAIEAHQPGSGKTLLANLARHIHGGVFRAEVPDDDAELRKQITSILSITTGPVVVLDNLSGALKSSTFAGLLTSAQWDDRPLGSTAWTRAVNDRIWTVTGNNMAIGGDLPRRAIRTVIDPGRPDPELRTGFAIPDLENWVKQHRGKLLHALLTIVRAWVAAGMPLPPEKTSDGYARWIRTIGGILAHAGIEGEFDHPSTRIQVGTDDDEWAEFLAAVHKVYGNRVWTVKEVLADVDTGSLINPGAIPMDALPGELADRAARPNVGPSGIAKSLGWWLRNRDGRWAGGLSVRSAGDNGHKIKQWRIFSSADTSDGRAAWSSGFPGSPGFSQPTRAPAFTTRTRSVTNRWGGFQGSAGENPSNPETRMIMAAAAMAEHFASTAAKPTQCPRCRAATLTALDEGLTATVDAQPLPDQAAEIAVLLEGRWTYTHTEYGHLVYRDAGRIAAGTLRGTIHAQHKCVGNVQLAFDDLIGTK